MAAITATLLFSGCQTEESGLPPAGVDIGQVGQLDLVMSNTEKMACEKNNGTVTIGFRGQVCAANNLDAGQSCDDDNQCQGFCLAETRQCSPHTPYFGCFQTMSNGRPNPALCAD